jgi:hypothetical protein
LHFLLLFVLAAQLRPDSRSTLFFS